MEDITIQSNRDIFVITEADIQDAFEVRVQVGRMRKVIYLDGSEGFTLNDGIDPVENQKDFQEITDETELDLTVFKYQEDGMIDDLASATFPDNQESWDFFLNSAEVLVQQFETVTENVSLDVFEYPSNPTH